MKEYSLFAYDYKLPQELIAQTPVPDREGSRLLYLDKKNGEVSHHRFSDLVHLISDKDVMVVNNTRVIPGRLYGKKESGGKVEVLMVDYAGGEKNKDQFIVKCLVKASKKPQTGSILLFRDDLKARVLDGGNGIYMLKFMGPDKLEGWLDQHGHLPLPPYIKRPDGKNNRHDRESYQTVYASKKGAVAAPTAGLHFTKSLIKKIKNKGVGFAEITLHVGYGTFLPVRTADIRSHKMHAERFFITDQAALRINNARLNGGRVIAVGTTCVRTLEFVSDSNGMVQSGRGECDLYIYPGYRFKTVDAMITNFHLPQSTLLMLVSAFVGRENILGAYSEAISQKYRFYSYGDAMYIG